MLYANVDIVARSRRFSISSSTGSGTSTEVVETGKKKQFLTNWILRRERDIYNLGRIADISIIHSNYLFLSLFSVCVCVISRCRIVDRSAFYTATGVVPVCLSVTFSRVNFLASPRNGATFECQHDLCGCAPAEKSKCLNDDDDVERCKNRIKNTQTQTQKPKKGNFCVCVLFFLLASLVVSCPLDVVIDGRGGFLIALQMSVTLRAATVSRPASRLAIQQSEQPNGCVSDVTYAHRVVSADDTDPCALAHYCQVFIGPAECRRPFVSLFTKKCVCVCAHPEKADV